MFRSDSKQCSSCQKNTNITIALDCGDEICLECLRMEVRKNEEREMLVDEIQIVCKVCDCMTYLSVVLAYKLVRQASFQDKQGKGEQLVCMDCLDDIFSVQKYLGGKHRNHKVREVRQSFAFFQNVLAYAGRSLQQSVNNLEKQSQKLGHFRAFMMQKVIKNTNNFKKAFQELRQQIERKEMSVLEQYQKIVEKQLKEIEDNIQQIELQLSKGKLHLKWLQQHVNKKEVNKNNSLQLATYFIKNHEKITLIDEFQQKIKASIPNHIELIQAQQQINTSQLVQDLKSIIQNTSFFPTKDNDSLDTSASSHLDLDYFDRKRKEVLGPAQNSQLFKLIYDKSRNDPSIQIMKRVRQQCSIPAQKQRKTVRLPKRTLLF